MTVQPPCPRDVEGAPGLNKTAPPVPRPCNPATPPGQEGKGGDGNGTAGGNGGGASDGGDRGTGHGGTGHGGGNDTGGHGNGGHGNGNAQAGWFVLVLPLSSFLAFAGRRLRRGRSTL